MGMVGGATRTGGLDCVIFGCVAPIIRLFWLAKHGYAVAVIKLLLVSLNPL